MSPLAPYFGALDDRNATCCTSMTAVPFVSEFTINDVVDRILNDY